MSDSGGPSDLQPDSAFRGSLEATPLPQILRQVFVHQLRGTLTLARPDDVRRLYFEKGELRTATSSRDTQRIGAFLRRRGRVSEDDIRRALDEISRQKGSRLGQKLVQRGLLTRAAIDAEMKRLVEEIVFSAFEWNSGEYRFDPSNAVLDPDVVLNFSTAAIIVEGIRRLPEGFVFRERLGEGHRVLRLSRDPMSRYQYLSLTPQEAYVLSRIDGSLDLDALLSITGPSRASSAKTIYALLSCGLVEWRMDETRRRETAGTVATLNVDVTNEPPPSTPGHAELVRSTWRRLDWLSHYDLLAVGRDASADDVRRAYFEKSRLFHPDLRHRPDLAGFERELTAVFERLKVAHDTLLDPEARADHDRSLDQPIAAVFRAERQEADPEARRQLAAKNFSRALDLIGEKDYFPAVELLQEAVRFAPDKSEYRFRLGEVELRNARWFERGLENLKEASRLAPTRVDFLRATARALLTHGRRQEAEVYARRAHDLEPDRESAELLKEVSGRPTHEHAPLTPEKAERRGGLLARLLGKGR